MNADMVRAGSTPAVRGLAALPDFSRLLAEDSAALREAAERRDFGELELLANRIKGACMMLGAVRLSESCSLIAMGACLSDVTAVQAALLLFERQRLQLDGIVTSPSGEAVGPSLTDQSLGICDGLKFVVVEDHDFQRGIIVNVLRRQGALSVEAFADCTSALEAMHAPGWTADIMLLDLSMPGMNGMDFIRRCVRTPRTPSLSLILISALSPSLLAQHILAARQHDIALLGAISKPMTMSNLAPLVARHRRLHSREPQDKTP
ncbi:MAG: response regulator [Ramlibacter sp.]